MKPVTLSNTAYLYDLGWTSSFCAVIFSVEVRCIGWIFSCISFLQQEHEPELQPPVKATCEVDKDTNKSRGKSWVVSIIRPLGSYTFLWYFLKKAATDETEVCLLGELLQLLIKILWYAYGFLFS